MQSHLILPPLEEVIDFYCQTEDEKELQYIYNDLKTGKVVNYSLDLKQIVINVLNENKRKTFNIDRIKIINPSIRVYRFSNDSKIPLTFYFSAPLDNNNTKVMALLVNEGTTLIECKQFIDSIFPNNAMVSFCGYMDKECFLMQQAQDVTILGMNEIYVETSKVSKYSAEKPNISTEASHNWNERIYQVKNIQPTSEMSMMINKWKLRLREGNLSAIQICEIGVIKGDEKKQNSLPHYGILLQSKNKFLMWNDSNQKTALYEYLLIHCLETSKLNPDGTPVNPYGTKLDLFATNNLNDAYDRLAKVMRSKARKVFVVIPWRSISETMSAYKWCDGFAYILTSKFEQYQSSKTKIDMISQHYKQKMNCILASKFFYGLFFGVNPMNWTEDWIQLNRRPLLEAAGVKIEDINGGAGCSSGWSFWTTLLKKTIDNDGTYRLQQHNEGVLREAVLFPRRTVAWSIHDYRYRIVYQSKNNEENSKWLSVKSWKNWGQSWVSGNEWKKWGNNLGEVQLSRRWWKDIVRGNDLEEMKKTFRQVTAVGFNSKTIKSITK